MSEAAERRRRAEKDARRLRILDAALDLAVAEGVEAVTTTRLAERLDYTVGALYRYWPSVDALLAALHQRTAELFYAAFVEAHAPALARLRGATSPEGRPLAEIALLPALYARLARENAVRFELVSQLVTRRLAFIDAAALAAVEPVVLPRIAELVATLHAGADSGALEPGDPVRRTMTLWVTAHAMLAVRPLAERHPGLFSADELLDEAVGALLRGWGADKDAIGAARRAAQRALAVGA